LSADLLAAATYETSRLTLLYGLSMLTAAEVALFVAGVALLGTAATVIQKRFTDRRDAWWTRTQWALERVIAIPSPDDTERTLGLVMLTRLQESRLASNEERKMLGEVAGAILASAPHSPGGATGQTTSSTTPTT
jgi:hypothetical protein